MGQTGSIGGKAFGWPPPESGNVKDANVCSVLYDPPPWLGMRIRPRTSPSTTSSRRRPARSCRR
jgi:hypothetical protein